MAATSNQTLAWSKFDTVEKIQERILGPDYAMYCGDQTNTAQECAEWTAAELDTECISQQIYDLLRANQFAFPAVSGRYYGFPECNRRSELLAICKCGCFVEGTRLLAVLKGSKNWVAIEKLLKDKGALATLEKDSEGYRLGKANQPAYLQSENAQREHRTVRIHYGIEGTNQILQVTKSHPILLANGLFAAASDVKPGDQLLDANAQLVNVTAVESDVPYVGKVYNVDTQSPSHVVFAEGVAVGDYKVQNELDVQKSRIHARR
jgi:hypothetical protein